MRDFSSWSLSLGRWRGVHIRLHAFFLLFAVFTLYLSTQNPARNLLNYGAASLLILFLSVLAHEIGHCVAAFRLGGGADQLVIGPLGGLGQMHVPHEPQCELIVSLAGPLVNLLILAVVGPAIMMSGRHIVDLLNPLQPREVIEGPFWIICAKLTFWLNWLLIVVNLLPAFPMDGGRILRAVLWPAFDYRTAALLVTRVAKASAVGLCLIAWLMRDAFAPAALPAWVPLALFAIFIFFSAQQEASRLEDQELEDDMFSYDFSQGYTSLERTFEAPRRTGPGPLRRWFDGRRAARLRRQRIIEQEEERQVDEILARLHQEGMERLSVKELALLERVSARYRNRQRSN